MTSNPQPGDDRSRPVNEEVLRSSYASFLARLEAGEQLEFEEWLRQRADVASDEEALRSLHEECAALEATLEKIAAENPPETLFFQPPTPADPADRDPREALRPEAGLRIGEYRLISRLGKGGMGEVWEAVHFGLQRRVALKLLDPDRFTERGVRFFDREARAGARVNEPGIVAVHAAGEDDGFLWIDQELVEGGRTLADFLREMRARPRLPEDYYHRVARFVADAARSMQVAHDQFVVHRDLKPGNILIGHGDRPKITDFGLARITDEQSVSRSGDLVGTYQYMSPEQISRGKHRADHRTDVFSLGVVLYELLTLQRPFDADSTQELVAHILHHREPDPCTIRGEVPRELGTICVRALQKSPNDRFASMSELADELERWLGGLPIHSRRPGVFTSLALWRRRHPTLSASLAVLVAALVPLIVVIARLGRVEQDSLYQTRVSAIRLAGIAEDLGGIRVALQQAREVDPDEPEALLTAAVGCVLCGDVPAAEALLAEALALGFDPGELESLDAKDQFLLGYFFLLEPSPERAERARTAFERVLALKENHRGALWGLYSTSVYLGDIPAARKWLERYRGRLINTDPTNAVVEALLVELEGEQERALELLQAILDDPEADPDDPDPLRVRRLIGKLALFRGDYRRAIDTLRAAVAEDPDDALSWSHLAVAAYHGAGELPDEEPESLLALAREASERGHELAPDWTRDKLMLVILDLLEIEGELEERVRTEPERWADLETRLDELELPAADPVMLAQIRSEALYLQGWDALLAHDLSAAITLFEDAVVEHEANVRAHFFLAQKLVDVSGVAEVERVLDHLERGLAAWQASLDPPDSWIGQPYTHCKWEARFGPGFQTWIAWAAAASGDVDRALEAAEAVEELLIDGPLPERAELLTYAEGLATLPDEFTEQHDRAREIVAEYELDEHFHAVPGASGILDLIAGAGR